VPRSLGADSCADTCLVQSLLSRGYLTLACGPGLTLSEVEQETRHRLKRTHSPLRQTQRRAEKRKSSSVASMALVHLGSSCAQASLACSPTRVPCGGHGPTNAETSTPSARLGVSKTDCRISGNRHRRASSQAAVSKRSAPEFRRKGKWWKYPCCTAVSGYWWKCGAA